jgi:transcriptional regulator with XRE-family HTH domain
LKISVGFSNPDRTKVEEMEEQGLTLREIASEVGISAASVSRLLRSRQRIPDPAAKLV